MHICHAFGKYKADNIVDGAHKQNTPGKNKNPLPCVSENNLIDCGWNPDNAAPHYRNDGTKRCDNSPKPSFPYTCNTKTYKCKKALCNGNQRHSNCITECLSYQLVTKHFYF